MKLSFSAADEAFRDDIAKWLNDNLCGEYAPIRFRGGPGDEHVFVEERKAWERTLAAGGWTCIAWPEQFGGKNASIEQQVIFNEEYARAGGPGRVGHIGETLMGPTLIEFGTPEQQAKYLPGIREGREYWCQGYSEPGAGSDLGNVKTRAVFDETTQQWRINGQKVWTSLAHESHYCFVVARTDATQVGHKGLGFFMVAMDQPGVTIRPIEQLTGTAEFNEVFFDDAVCGADDILGQPGQGWAVAMALLGYERGVSTLGQQMLFQNELDEIVRLAKTNGAANDPSIRQRIAEAHMGLKTMRFNSMRMLSGGDGSQLSREAMIYKLYWSSWHRNLGKLAMDVMGDQAEVLPEGPYCLDRLQSMFLFTRADTIYGGTNQIQRNLIAERALGLPREPRGQS